MKKLSKVLLIFLLSFLLAGCGTKETQGDTRQNSMETLSNDAGSLVTAGSVGEEGRAGQTDDGTESAETANGTGSGEASEPEDEANGIESEAAAGSDEAANGAETEAAAEPEETANGTEAGDAQGTESEEEVSGLPEDGTYTSKEDVALYLHLYGHLPSNFITKKEAEKLGWTGGSLEPYAPGMCIGGNRFGNYEGLLPEKEGRVYTECDIDTLEAEKRGAKRIVFSNDGLIYYTEDHYQNFELLYGDE